jgi:hypothetical protein
MTPPKKPPGKDRDVLVPKHPTPPTGIQAIKDGAAAIDFSGDTGTEHKGYPHADDDTPIHMKIPPVPEIEHAVSVAAAQSRMQRRVKETNVAVHEMAGTVVTREMLDTKADKADVERLETKLENVSTKFDTKFDGISEKLDVNNQRLIDELVKNNDAKRETEVIAWGAQIAVKQHEQTAAIEVKKHGEIAAIDVDKTGRVATIEEEKSAKTARRKLRMTIAGAILGIATSGAVVSEIVQRLLHR